MTQTRQARFSIGDVVRHRIFPFRGVVFDVDPEFANTEDWWLSIPEEIRPRKDQPFYHLLAENAESFYTAYVSEQNLLPDAENGAVGHPEAAGLFERFDGERYRLKGGAAGEN
jgi:heat shock protein HspQ